jgi:hypothetical protein
MQTSNDHVISGGAVGVAVRASISSPVDVNASPTTTAKTGMRSRASRSDVWQDMKEVKKVVSGKEVRCGVICNYCKSCLSSPSTCGTDHSRCCIGSCKKKAFVVTTCSQSHMHFDSNGNVQRF